MGIKLSPQHGLNPALLKCIICDAETGEIGLFGHVKEKGSNGKAIKGTDVQMPMYTRQGLCDRCKGLLAEGNVGFIADNGSTTIIKGEAVKRMMGKNADEIIGKVVRVHNPFWER
jgi:hypothetical protein